MSNSRAAAVLTTPDLAEALHAVRTLLGLADLSQAEVDFEATLRTPQALTRVLRLMPDLKWRALAGEEHGSSESGADPLVCLPVSVHDWCHPLDLAEPFIAALGRDSAGVRWDLNGWPEVPEAGLCLITQKYAYLTLSVNSRDLYQDEPAPDHTVYVHVRDVGLDLDRVEWLAARAGGRFEGKVELSPL
ncbi:hypothetical protein SGFS_073670 [Streptomyces graminofaciens]|uniref:Uncharacterized protein n=1 Tax=Streptomyces graminofaciens TaxID=68212 RepID=A0ABM7FI76_9ACTN|nr:hypothetical protein [Streptomyces graminofaciens]BBC36073.1 hypothetical protein SGFS_073670 [Streptomyces graminofaciens]